MIAAIVRALWHRRRSEALVVIEVLATFLVVAAVATVGVLFLERGSRPLGYDASGVLRIEATGVGDLGESDYTERRRGLIAGLEQIPGVEVAAGAAIAPWEFSDWTQSADGIEVQGNWVTPGLSRVLRLDLVAGRFFEDADTALPWLPVVINQDLADRLFGDSDPLGQVADFGGSRGPSEAESRVVGVVSDFREDGELGGPMLYVFHLASHPTRLHSTDLLVRLRPDAPSSTERHIAERLRELAPDWTFEIRPLAEVRRLALRMKLAPLVVAAAAALFLLVTVGLGLTGVVWQNVARRTRELGLRRAIGATRRGILAQVVLEVVVVALAGISLGVLVLVQLPLFGFGALVPGHVLTIGALVAAGMVITLGVLCALQPGRQAMRVPPAEALRRG